MRHGAPTPVQSKRVIFLAENESPRNNKASCQRRIYRSEQVNFSNFASLFQTHSHFLLTKSTFLHSTSLFATTFLFLLPTITYSIMPSGKEDGFLGCASPSGRTKIKRVSQTTPREDEDKRPNVWVCRDQDPEPNLSKRRSWKALRVINKPGLLDKEFGE